MPKLHLDGTRKQCVKYNNTPTARLRRRALNFTYSQLGYYLTGIGVTRAIHLAVFLPRKIFVVDRTCFCTIDDKPSEQ
jgi:hypothetical protein